MSDDMRDIHETLGVLKERSEQTLHLINRGNEHMTRLEGKLDKKNEEQDKRIDALESLGMRVMATATICSTLAGAAVSLVSKFWHNITHS